MACCCPILAVKLRLAVTELPAAPDAYLLSAASLACRPGPRGAAAVPRDGQRLYDGRPLLG
jgi:hypothetical protein